MNNLQVIKDIQILYTNQVVLYGASHLGKETKEILEMIGVKHLLFCDSNEDKVHGNVEGCYILSFKELEDLCRMKDVCIVITSMYIDEIKDKIKKGKVRYKQLLTTYSLRNSIYINFDAIKEKLTGAETVLALMELWREKAKNDIIYDWRSFINRTISSCIQGDSLLIYQCGKVGSKSVAESLKVMGVSCHHLHTLTYHPLFMGYSEEAYFHYLRLIKKKEIKIISLVREPISRDISMFWEIYPYLLANGEIDKDLNSSFLMFAKKYLYGEENDRDKKQQKTELDLFFEYLLKKEKYGQMFHWFQTEMKKVFDIDVFQYNFDKEKGYNIINKNNISLLLLQLEKLDGLEKVIGDFIGIKEFKLIKANESKSKPYYYLYKEMIESIQLPDEYMACYYNANPFMEHFYNAADIKKFRMKWENNSHTHI